jgi:hypothetical protein
MGSSGRLRKLSYRSAFAERKPELIRKTLRLLGPKDIVLPIQGGEFPKMEWLEPKEAVTIPTPAQQGHIPDVAQFLKKPPDFTGVCPGFFQPRWSNLDCQHRPDRCKPPAHSPQHTQFVTLHVDLYQDPTAHA